MVFSKSFKLSDLQDFVGNLPPVCPECGNILRYSIQFDLVTNECLLSVDCPNCELCSEVVLTGSVAQSDFSLCSFNFLNLVNT